MKDPRYSYVYNLSPLRGNDIKVSTEEYDYYFRICDRLTTGLCKPSNNSGNMVSSCQIKKQEPLAKKIAGKVILRFVALICYPSKCLHGAFI